MILLIPRATCAMKNAQNVQDARDEMMTTTTCDLKDCDEKTGAVFWMSANVNEQNCGKIETNGRFESGDEVGSKA